MSDGAKQFMAWTMAFGLSATVYGGGAYWVKKSSAHHDNLVHNQHGDAHHGASKEHHTAEEHPSPGEHHPAPAHGEAPHNEASHAESARAEAGTSHHEPVKHEAINHPAHEEHAAPKLAQAKNSAEHPADHKDAAKHTDAAAPEHQSTDKTHGVANQAGHSAPHWSYAKNDAGGPSHWGDLAKNFAMCEKGLEQSPVDLTKPKASKIAPKVEWHYGSATVQVENNGHTIQSNLAGDKHHIKIDGEKFQLAQFHFHSPSEHRISGTPSDMELHFVHKNSSGGLAVIGVMINELAGRENKFFKPIWDIIPRDLHTKASGPTKVSLESLLPSGRQYFHYQGSLTTPPCSEGVRWFVLKDAITMSSGQIEMYTSIFQGPTNRPVQALQGREIITNGPPVLAH